MYTKVFCFFLLVACAYSASLPSTSPKSLTDAGSSSSNQSVSNLNNTIQNAYSSANSNIQDKISSILGQSSFTQLLNLSPLGNLTSALSQVDFSKVNQSVPLIPPLLNISAMPVLPGLRENIQYARNLTTYALGGKSDLYATIQNATENAIHSIVPVGSLSVMCYTILHIYYEVAENSPLYIVGAAVLQDGLVLIGEVIKSVVSIVSSDLSKLAASKG